MLTRLTHAAIAFAMTVVVYQAYVLLAAPLIEPPVAGTAPGPGLGGTGLVGSDEGADLTPVHKYRELLAAYFDPGHWTLTQPPITAENGDAMVVIDEFNPRDDGLIRVNKCAILFFPSGRVRGEPPPTDAVVLEAPQGAVLQMDKSYQQGAGGFGRIQSGRLIGKITVRSDMRQPGPQDDLLLTTHDVEIQENLIYTLNEVDMQLGPHRGHGRQLEIRLVAVERSRTGGSSSFGNIDYLEVIKDVQAELSPASLKSADNPLVATSEDTPPVQVTSDGRFRFDFSQQVASFSDNVLLKQQHPTGELDKLECDTLAIYLANRSDETKVDSALGNVAVGTIRAKGSQDSQVVLDAPFRQAAARCDRMSIEVAPRRITLERDSAEDVMFRYEGNEVHASRVQYEAPPQGSPRRIGDFKASGRGHLTALTSDKLDAKPFEVTWAKEMLLRRINGKPVLTLNGRPRLDMVGMGQLWADALDLYLRESAADGSEDELLPAEVVPDRLVASGRIAIESEQLNGRVKQLEVNFDYAPSNLQLGAPDGNDARSGSPLGRRGGGLRRTYDITGQTLQMLVTVRQKKPEVTSIDVDGQVVFNESSSTLQPTKEPLQVFANHLHVENADSPSAQITLTGKPATIAADGMLIRTENLQIHRGESRAWVDTPGEVEIMVDRDLNGKPLAVPQPAVIRWQQSMELERDRLKFSGNVQVQTAEGTLDTQHLVVRLTAPVQFDGAADQRQIEIAQLECHGGANAIFSQRDAQGLSSIQTIKLEESFSANLQTGRLHGEGPGRIESVHLSTGNNPLGDFGNAGGQNQLAAARSPRAEQRLRFLGLQFVRGFEGNLKTRRVKVMGDVDAVYGPVDAWEQRLELTKRGMPGPDTIWINSQTLQVAESPSARLQQQASGLGPIELEATGHVTIEGPAGQRGNFTTHSRSAKYDQSKRIFILEGDNRQPATIIFQEFRGGPTSPTSAQKITYFQDTGNIQVNGLMSGQLRQLAPADGQR